MCANADRMVESLDSLCGKRRLSNAWVGYFVEAAVTAADRSTVKGKAIDIRCNRIVRAIYQVGNQNARITVVSIFMIQFVT